MNFFIKTKNINIECFSLKTETSNKIIQNLPIKAKIKTWGDEIYFDTKLRGILLEKEAKEVFNLGEIAYWTEGNSIAIGFGPTPASLGSEIRLVTKCNYWAKAKNPQDLLNLKKFNDGDQIIVDLKG